MKRLYPFEVTGSNGKKKLTKNGVNIAAGWLKMIYGTDTLPHVARCRSGNWLDWTGNNIWCEWSDTSQETFEQQNSYHKRLVRISALEILDARARQAAGCHESASDEIREIFRDAQRLPAAPTRPSGYASE